MDLYEERQRRIIRGLQIFGEAGHWGVDAQHDEILAGPEGRGNLTDEQVAELGELHWHETEGEGWGFFT